MKSPHICQVNYLKDHSGVYIYQLDALEEIQTGKLLLLR